MQTTKKSTHVSRLKSKEDKHDVEIRNDNRKRRANAVAIVKNEKRRRECRTQCYDYYQQGKDDKFVALQFCFFSIVIL